MKSLRLFTLLIALLPAGESAFAQSWQLVWSDEFTNGIGPD